ncbi:MAG: TonB-dependent receptor [Alphaproteobacteria bacterium]|nr:TonB-dependent receptor [Alphaproteobacteria bacterium]MDX5369088.1 TonB-dependent receptor [Alphaproteobacteria bacterium]MDX5463781.1 TonB-dependent receptor [Alphaproteobacteria bacterium]
MTEFTLARAAVRARGLALLAASPLVLLTPALAQGSNPNVERIVIRGTGQASTAVDPSTEAVSPKTPSRAPASDTAEFLRSVPGVNAGRMGGHGLEPVIRGLQQNQLNVIDAGAFTFGACPNRMDPPTSTSALGKADRIIIERGYQTVTRGPGGSGGTIVLERDAPRFAEGQRFRLDALAGFVANSSTKEAEATAAADLGLGFYAKASGGYRNAGNYEDGDGNEVNTAYETRGWSAEGGLVREWGEIALSMDRERTTDALFPGAGMDSPYDRATVYRARGRFEIGGDALKEIEASAYFSTVDHVMDNFSLRTPPGMPMRTPSESDTIGGRLAASFYTGGIDLVVGADLQSNNRDAAMFMGPLALITDPSRTRWFMWPDVTIRQIGVFAEGETEIADFTRAKVGLRFDRVTASAGKADRAPALAAGQTPNDLYLMRYGTDFSSDRTENNVGGLLRFEHDLTPTLTLFAGLSRSVRTADATERAMARMDWTGNPDIEPEKHHQADVGFEYGRSDLTLGGVVFVDKVDDFILRDAFTVPGATTYRNVDALLAGVEMSGAWRRGGLTLSGNVAFTWGENETDGRALAQIPPASGTLQASYGDGVGAGAWEAGARVNWALRQGRIDPARDVRETPGYATLDLFGSYALTPNAELQAGVTNVLDAKYANHLSRSNILDPTEVQVNEAGRSAYIRLNLRF